MNAYRLSGTVTADRTITVRVPEATVGDEAEVIVLFPVDSTRPPAEHPLRTFLEGLRERPHVPGGAQRADDAQDFVRELRDEWDRP